MRPLAGERPVEERVHALVDLLTWRNSRGGLPTPVQKSQPEVAKYMSKTPAAAMPQVPGSMSLKPLEASADEVGLPRIGCRGRPPTIQAAARVPRRSARPNG